MKIGKYFEDKEFFKLDTRNDIVENGHELSWHINQELVGRLDQIREHFGKPVHINSGFRSFTENINAGSKQKYSMHQYGIAADFKIEGITTREIFDYIVLTWNTGAVGLYDTFIHIDIRNSNRLITWGDKK